MSNGPACDFENHKFTNLCKLARIKTCHQGGCKGCLAGIPNSLLVYGRASNTGTT